jgi:NAD(P)-dependent dehydrogenase (short-subunit alcohol dehydrogenase family)
VPAKKRTALVTGANRGLGFESCLQLAQLGVTVILSAQNIIKGTIAAKELAGRGLDDYFIDWMFQTKTILSG